MQTEAHWRWQIERAVMDDCSGELLCGFLFGPVSPAQSERHYGCFMLACRIPLKRLMPGSLSQPRTCYPPAACSDLVNEFISSVATAGSAPPRSHTLCRARVVSRGSSKTSSQCNDSNFASCLQSGCTDVRLSSSFFPHPLYKFFPKNVNFSRTMQNTF